MTADSVSEDLERLLAEERRRARGREDEGDEEDKIRLVKWY